MKGQTYVILAIVFIILISIFAVLNVEVVEVNYLFWSGTSPLVFVILFSVLLGGVVTAFVSMKKYYELKRETKQLRQQIISLETELEGFKTSSLSSETDNND